MITLEYTPPTTLRNFMLSAAFGRLVAGPVGSGKTHACIIEILRRAGEQSPGQDGLRHTKWAIVRQTLKQIKDTIVPDIERLLHGIVAYRVSDSSVRIWFGDVRCTILLIPLENLADQGRLLSSNLTGAWISEGIEIDVSLIGPISGRIGRYPNGAHGVPTWSGIIMDTNFPIEGGEWYEFMENPPDTWEVFRQPGGLTPYAENLQWLNQNEDTIKLPENHPLRLARGVEYYRRLLAGTTTSYQTRYVHADYGPDPSGSAVYKESFIRSFHVVPTLAPVPQMPLLVGQDFGRNPCSLICQVDHKGRLLILEEVMSLEMGLEMAVNTKLRPALMQPRYLGLPIVLIGDPAGRAKSSLYEVNEYDLLMRMGFSAVEAPTNDIEPRIQAMEIFLNGQRQGGPAVMMDASRCPVFVQGMSGSYKFGKLKSGEMKAKPDKSGKWSHPQDCGQYVALVANNPGTYAYALQQLRSKVTAKRGPISPRAWT